MKQKKSSVKLNNLLRAEILRDVSEKVHSNIIDKARAKYTVEVEKQFWKENPALKLVPEEILREWVPHSKYVRCEELRKGTTYRQDVFTPFPASANMGNCVYLKHAPAKLLEAENELVASIEAKSKFKSDLQNVLASCTNTAQVASLVPEIEKYLPKAAKDIENALVPIELIDRVRKSLGGIKK